MGIFCKKGFLVKVFSCLKCGAVLRVGSRECGMCGHTDIGIHEKSFEELDEGSRVTGSLKGVRRPSSYTKEPVLLKKTLSHSKSYTKTLSTTVKNTASILLSIVVQIPNLIYNLINFFKGQTPIEFVGIVTAINHLPARRKEPDGGLFWSLRFWWLAESEASKLYPLGEPKRKDGVYDSLAMSEIHESVKNKTRKEIHPIVLRLDACTLEGKVVGKGEKQEVVILGYLDGMIRENDVLVISGHRKVNNGKTIFFESGENITTGTKYFLK